MAASILPTLGTGASAYGQFIPAGAPAGDSLDTYVASGSPAGGH